jgi:hypothetical protein
LRLDLGIQVDCLLWNARQQGDDAGNDGKWFRGYCGSCAGACRDKERIAEGTRMTVADCAGLKSAMMVSELSFSLMTDRWKPSNTASIIP